MKQTPHNRELYRQKRPVELMNAFRAEVEALRDVRRIMGQDNTHLVRLLSRANKMQKLAEDQRDQLYDAIALVMRQESCLAAAAFGVVGTTIRLRSGCYLDLLDPRPEHFTFADIAGALSKLCRFGGQVDRFYSVAEHSFHCAHLAMLDGHSVDVQRAVLMHDAAEAFIGDIVKPLKLQLPLVATIERRIENVIGAKYGALGFAAYETIIREIDQAMLIHERRQLFSTDEVTWAGENETRNVSEYICVTGWDAATAECYFSMAAKWIGIEVRA